jgi:hypothetical protein
MTHRCATQKLKPMFRFLSKVFGLVLEVFLVGRGACIAFAGQESNVLVKLGNEFGILVNSLACLVPVFRVHFYCGVFSYLLDEILALLQELVVPITMQVPIETLTELFASEYPELSPWLKNDPVTDCVSRSENE